MAIPGIISTTAILNTSRSGPGKFPTLVGYSSVLTTISNDMRFRSESRSLSQELSDPDKSPSFNVCSAEVI